MSSQQPQPDEPLPASGRLAAIDFGTVRMGIAICDPERILVSPLVVYSAKGWKDDGDYFRQLAARERIVAYIVGLPIHCDGGESQKSIECREFAKWLAQQTELPVRLFDERFTTADAKQRMAGGAYSRKKEKKRIDAVAAMVLLESYLESCRYHDNVAGQRVDSIPRGGDALDS